ncbi:MAG: GrpB family protein [Bacteroidia bacterium]
MLIVEYQASWAADFGEIRRVLADALAGLAIRVEHVGSTAVRGLAAKPIIDIDVVYEVQADWSDIVRRLAALGYRHNGDQGIAGREVFKRDHDRHPVLDSISHHLYVCHEGSAELEQHLAFRDYLADHEATRQAYAELKYEIAAMAHQDKTIYAALKAELARDFIASVLARAAEARA